MFTLSKPFLGYEEGDVLIDVPLRVARALECNRCGDCCDGDRENVKKDEETGFPLLTWGSRFPQDLYEARYGVPLIQPLIRGDGGIVVGKAFENDSDGKPYTAFKCSMLNEHPEGGCETSCKIRDKYPNPDPKRLEQMQPRSCGEFPIFGLDVDATIIDGHPFIPPVGALPRCTWYGMRIVGPWKDTPAWEERWERQQAGETVEPVADTAHFADGIEVLLERRETLDGSVRKKPDDGIGGVSSRFNLDTSADPAGRAEAESHGQSRPGEGEHPSNLIPNTRWNGPGYRSIPSGGDALGDSQ